MSPLQNISLKESRCEQTEHQAACQATAADPLAVFTISFHPIRELPIESNPNCSVNWLTAQKVKRAKYHQFSVIQLVSFQQPFVK